MTTEQMKELYALGDWVFLYKTRGYGWQKYTNAKLQENITYKLIHKKHKEVLDHVLAGDSVYEILGHKNHLLPIQFFEHYNPNATYEIIKEKQSLNGKYCPATKEGVGTCSKCKEEKPLSEFSNTSRNKPSCWCKQCVSKSSSNYQRTRIGRITSMYNSQVKRSKEKSFKEPSYTKEELIEWVLKQENFNYLFSAWENNNFDKELSPSVDRLDDYENYNLQNIRLVTWKENKERSYADRKNGVNNKTNMAVVQFDKEFNFMGRFHSVSEASRQTGSDKTNILRVCRGKQQTHRNHIWRFENEAE